MTAPRTSVSPDQPLRFLPNRAWRCYRGGALLDKFRSGRAGTDGHFPEDWLASTTPALNGPNSQGPEEGLARVALPDGKPGPLFRDLLRGDPAAWLGAGRDASDGVGVLCKFLDSAIRLPIQCHPDRAQAKALYKSSHGKAESWTVLDTRPIRGETPYLLMGFKPGISEAAFRAAVKQQDIAALESALHKVPAAPGETWFIPGRFPHAIGPGVFMLEVQEPSDWVVQIEDYCGEQKLSHNDMWGPLDAETAMGIFAYKGTSVETMRKNLLMKQKPLAKWGGGSLTETIGASTTDCFGLRRLTVDGRLDEVPKTGAEIAIVTAGTGTLRSGGTETTLTQGDVLFLGDRIRNVGYEGRNLTVRLVSGVVGKG